MADVRLGIDASGARQGADEFIRQIERIQRAAREAAQASQGRVDFAVNARQEAAAIQQTTEALNRKAQAQKSATKAAQDEERARLAQIRAGISYLRVINDEQASYARRVDASLRYAKALGVELDTKKLLIGVQNQVNRAMRESAQATSVAEIASRNL